MKKVLEILKKIKAQGGLEEFGKSKKVKLLNELFDIFSDVEKIEDTIVIKLEEITNNEDDRLVIFAKNYDDVVENAYCIQLETKKTYSSDISEIINFFENLKIEKPVVALLNTTIATCDGMFEIKTISLDEAKKIIAGSELDSAIEHQSTADIMSTLLETDIQMNRQLLVQQVNQQAIVFKLKGRPAEGQILSIDEIEKIGYEFKLMTRIR